MVNINTNLSIKSSANTGTVKSLKSEQTIFMKKNNILTGKVSITSPPIDDEYTKMNVVSFKRSFSKLQKNYSIDY